MWNSTRTGVLFYGVPTGTGRQRRHRVPAIAIAYLAAVVDERHCRAGQCHHDLLNCEQCMVSLARRPDVLVHSFNV